MKKIIIILFLYFLNSNSAYSIAPDVFVQSTVNRASQILSKNISKEEKINELKSIASETVDIQGVGFYSLGLARKNLDQNQKIKVINLQGKVSSESMGHCGLEEARPEKRERTQEDEIQTWSL